MYYQSTVTRRTVNQAVYTERDSCNDSPMEATASQIIDAIGGTFKVAQLCELSAQAVCNWRTKGIPKPWRKYLQAVRPDVFEKN